MRLNNIISWGMAILLSAVVAAQGQNSPQACTIFQSPRNVNPKPWPGVYNGNPPNRERSLVTRVNGAATIVYNDQTLVRCDQHYHVPVENTQGCDGETTGKLPPPGEVPDVNQWVEVHTVYAPGLKPTEDCKDALDHNLQCCVGDPIVVRGFSARVRAGEGPVPVIQPDSRPLAEWTGSNTGGAACPGDCKPIQAQWSFRLDCSIRVSQGQLKALTKAHEARCPQPDDRLSHDLTLVGTPPAAGSSDAKATGKNPGSKKTPQ